MRLETERLLLREVTMDDLNDWYEILSDKETMRYYPAPFSREKVEQWIKWNSDNYQRCGFGLCAVILKENGKFIGDCGITMQMIDGKQQPEIGFHISKAYWRKGYASEAARACRDYAFDTLRLPAVYCYQKYTNEPSQKTALKIGLTFFKQYPDEKNTFTTVYRMTGEQYQALKRA